MRKLLACLVLVGACLIASTSPAPAGALPCSYICCNEYQPDTECSNGTRYTNTCYTWWHEGGECP